MINLLKKHKTYILIALFFMFIYFFMNFVVYIGSRTECGQIKRIGVSKGARYVILEFYVDNIKYTCSQTNSDFKTIDFNDLKKINCIKIEYSTFLPFFNRVVDKRVLK